MTLYVMLEISLKAWNNRCTGVVSLFVRPSAQKLMPALSSCSLGVVGNEIFTSFWKKFRHQQHVRLSVESCLALLQLFWNLVWLAAYVCRVI